MIDEFRCAAPQGLEKIEQRLIKLEMLLVEGLSDDISEHLDVYIRRLRLMRSNLFPASFFSDPIWDILLELNRARRSHAPMTIAELARATAIGHKVLKRCVDLLKKEGFVTVTKSQSSPDWVIVKLTNKGVDSMNRLFNGFVETVNFDLEKARLAGRMNLAA